MKKHQHGGDIYTASYKIDYSSNINPLGMPKGVVEAAKKGVEKSACYPDVNCGELRMVLAKKEGVEEEQIICGSGAAELIFSVAAAEKPRKALLTAPGFAEYEHALKIQGCEILYYPLLEENGFQVGEDYLDYLTEDLDMVYLCNPNNPTGILTERNRILQIVDRCSQNGIRVVLDLCFQEFVNRPEEVGLVSWLQAYSNLFILKAFTKTYAMAGLRLGYGLSSDSELLERMHNTVQPWSVSIPAQMAGIAALKEKNYVEEARRLVKEERKWMKKKLERLGFTVFDSKANYVFFRGPEDLAEKCARQGILIRDCSNYRGLKKGFYRVAVRTHGENKKLMEVLGQE